MFAWLKYRKYYKLYCKNYQEMVCGNPSKPQEITNQSVKTEKSEVKKMEKITVYFVKKDRKPVEKVFTTREECNAYYMGTAQRMRGVQTIVLQTIKVGA